MSVLRRHSSRQGLQDLQRITVQRSLEDAEEIEREQRRRERASSSTVPPQDTCSPGLCEDSLCKSDQKPSWLSSWEGDDGFSSCLEQVERQRQTEKCEKEVHFNSSAHLVQSQPSSSTHQHLNGLKEHIGSAPLWQTPPPLSEQRDQRYQELNMTGEWRTKEQEAREKEECRMAGHREGNQGEWEKMAVRQGDKDMCVRSGEWQRQDANKIVREQRKEMKISYTTRLHLQKDLRCDTTKGVEETIRKTPCLGEEKVEAGSEMNAGPQGEDRTLTYHEEERQSVKGENEEEKVEEETDEERLKRMREEEKEKKRRSVMEKMKRLSLSSTETDEPFSPLSPTLMVEEAQGLTEEYMCSISERTESLNRSVKKSFQRTPPPSMIISKIDSRLEQYNHAIEASSQEVRDAKAGLFDFPSSPEPVSARKNLFEVGDAWNQNSGKAASSKDTEGLKVGVADLITQWVKGNPDVNSKTPPSKPTSNEVKAGEVHQKKSLWETKDTSKAENPGGKASMGKKFKFVGTGHGKYEKVCVDDKDSVSHTNVKSSQ
ncbi:lymphocyte-specific protein 1 isoform X2 [Colossoma macropomum]|uniref:lymphocyte-specific protein 1 isoform X2 n=1 Tax=Colossoma macropomum TaxID=42526 RepID=UPI00186511BB|nr:lymphocyte-specific protein 1 isoform X2 [Colossoma macropomum]